MTSNKISFDWSVLDRESLYDILYGSYHEIVAQELKSTQIHKILSKQITSFLPIKVSRKLDFEVDNNFVYIGGVYHSDEDRSKRKSIEIIFVYNPTDEYLKISGHKFKRMATCFADTVLHEIIHMRQFRRRKFKYLPDYASNAEKVRQRQEQSYLGCSDEIDAYSFNIACELRDRFFGDKRKIINYINKNKLSTRKNDTWKMYLKAFDNDHNHEVIKKVKKKIILYLDKAELGKPYRTRDWINR